VAVVFGAGRQAQEVLPVVVELVATERQLGRDRDGHHHRRVLVLGSIPPFSSASSSSMSRWPVTRSSTSSTGGSRSATPNCPVGVGELDTAGHDFEEAGRWAMSFRFAHG
jgi:hypothetical protein